jgi:hypothetical protein
MRFLDDDGDDDNDNDNDNDEYATQHRGSTIYGVRWSRDKRQESRVKLDVESCLALLAVGQKCAASGKG